MIGVRLFSMSLDIYQYMIKDSIVVWRTRVIWGRDDRVVIFPVICILAAIGMLHYEICTEPSG